MIAKEYGADLFISIHADASINRTAAGSSVYCLSTGAASSEAAKILARNENLADVIGGVPGGEIDDASDAVILSMFQTDTLNRSRTIGGSILRHIGGTNGLKFATVQEAPFLVLKLPDVPSVLIETAYISNPKEEKLLRNPQFQKRIAERIVRSVVASLPPLAPLPGPRSLSEQAGRERDDREAARSGRTHGEDGQRRDRPTDERSERAALTWEEIPSGREKGAFYRVQRGDTLYGIARKHGTSVKPLLVLNNMKLGDRLYAGRMVRITGTTRGRAIEKPLKTGEKRSRGATPAHLSYRVKKGDTLTAIAQKHGTTVRTLAEMNHLNPAKALPVDRKLLLPGKPAM